MSELSLLMPIRLGAVVENDCSAVLAVIDDGDALLPLCLTT